MIKYSNLKLEIFKKTLPPDHFDIQNLEERIQFVKDILEPSVKSLRELGNETFYNSNFDQALIYYQQALDEELKSSNSDYSNVFGIHFEIAQVHAKKDGNHTSEVNYLQKLIGTQYLDDTLHSAVIYSKIAEIYGCKLKNSEEELKNYEKCLEIRTKLLLIDDRLIDEIERSVKTMEEWLAEKE
ncbi:unnamed protein product [Rotaria sp. Silwood1]|nr:unnamed protein product [Rotaria sp. Silwood1]